MPVSGISEEKRALRRQYRELREQLGTPRRRSADWVMTERFLSQRAYRECKTLLIYASTPIECNTHDIIKRALIDGKRLALPKCVPETKELRFYIINSLEELKDGFYGIKEPDPSKGAEFDDFYGALCLVPGLAFDRRGFRLGFGGGYYDRFLKDFAGSTAAICYDCCVADELPVNEYDIGVGTLITEKKTYRFTDKEWDL